MATSKVELVNKALTLIGANPIVSLDDPDQNARVINRVYEISLCSILSQCKWNFATKRAMLSSVVDTLAWYDSGEVYVYQKPVDMVRPFGVSSLSAVWREEGEYIISDTQGLGMRYVYFLDNPSKYSASFIEAFTDKLASDIAYMIVNSATLGEKYARLYVVSLANATSENAQSGTQQVPEDGAWELAKYQDGNVKA